MNEAVCWVGTWNTPKTKTTELVIGTKHGMASFRIVESANGHKVDVFSGFDPVFAPLAAVGQEPACSDNGMPSPAYIEFWEHRYIGSMEKATTKWSGRMEQVGPFVEANIFDAINRANRTGADLGPIKESLSIPGDAYDRWEMLFGRKEGVPSAPAQSAKGRDAAQTRQAKKVEREQVTASRYANDDLWGSF